MTEAEAVFQICALLGLGALTPVLFDLVIRRFDSTPPAHPSTASTDEELARLAPAWGAHRARRRLVPIFLWGGVVLLGVGGAGLLVLKLLE